MAKWLVFEVVREGEMSEALNRIGAIEAGNVFAARDIALVMFAPRRLVVQSAIDHQVMLEEDTERAKNVKPQQKNNRRAG